MPDSEFALYKGFVDRTLSEVEKGLALDNYGAGSLKRRVHETLTAWKTSDGAERRCPAEKVVDGRFILGGDDASYLANGLAMLWSTVGCNDEKHNELGLAPAALYSPDAVNGIRRGLLAAFEKKNEKMRNDAGNQLANLMGALLPIVPFVCDTQGERESMHDFLETRVVADAEQRKKLFAFLMRAKRALDKNGSDGRDIPASSLAFQILAKAKEAHETAMAIAKRERERVVNEMNAQMQAQMEKCNKSIEECEALLAEKEEEVARCEKARTQWEEKYNGAREEHLRELQKATQAFEVKQLADDAARRVIKQTTDMAIKNDAKEIERLKKVTKDGEAEIARLTKKAARDAKSIARLERAVDAQSKRTAEVRLDLQKNVNKAKEQLEREKNRANQVRAVLKQQVDARNRAILDKDGQILTLEEAVYALRAKVAETEGDKGALLKAEEVMRKAQSALRKCESAGKALEQQERAHRQTILGLTGRVLLLKLRRDKLTKELNEMSQEKEQALADANARHEEEIERVMLKNMQDTVAEAAKQGTEMQQIQESYEAQLAALKEQNAQDQSEQLQALREQHEAQLADLTSKFEQQRAEWTQSVGALKAELDTANAHSSALDAQLAQATQARQACEQRVADCAADARAVEEAEKDLLAANEKVAACEAELDAERKKCDAKQTDLDALNDRMQKKWFELLDDLAYFKRQEEMLTTILSATRDNLQAATRDNDEEDVEQLSNDMEMLTQELAAATDAKNAVTAWLQDIVKVFTGTETESYDVFSTAQDAPPYAAPAFLTDAASNDDAWISTAVYRGLVGQRGPTESADVAHCPQDALLPYALPDIDAAVKHLLPAQLLLRSTPDPTGEEVDRAVAALNACKRADGAKRQRVDELDSPAVTSEALALFQDDFAITSTTPAAELPAERCGVELPHEVRWMPQGPRGATMARVAVLEHAVARCGQLAAAPGVRPSVATALAPRGDGAQAAAAGAALRAARGGRVRRQSAPARHGRHAARDAPLRHRARHTLLPVAPGRGAAARGRRRQRDTAHAGRVAGAGDEQDDGGHRDAAQRPAAAGVRVQRVRGARGARARLPQRADGRVVRGSRPGHAADGARDERSGVGCAVPRRDLYAHHQPPHRRDGGPQSGRRGARPGGGLPRRCSGARRRRGSGDAADAAAGPVGRDAAARGRLAGPVVGLHPPCRRQDRRQRVGGDYARGRGDAQGGQSHPGAALRDRQARERHAVEDCRDGGLVDAQEQQDDHGLQRGPAGGHRRGGAQGAEGS